MPKHGNSGCEEFSEHTNAEYLDQPLSENQPEQDIEALIALLDGYTEAGDSRIKVDVVEGEGEVIARQYHHGRCDVGSPWACGTAFDVLE